MIYRLAWDNPRRGDFVLHHRFARTTKTAPHYVKFHPKFGSVQYPKIAIGIAPGEGESGGDGAPVLTVEYIPEPATMCLLGLGGHMLDRRKKA